MYFLVYIRLTSFFVKINHQRAPNQKQKSEILKLNTRNFGLRIRWWTAFVGLETPPTPSSPHPQPWLVSPALSITPSNLNSQNPSNPSLSTPTPFLSASAAPSKSVTPPFPPPTPPYPPAMAVEEEAAAAVAVATRGGRSHLLMKPSTFLRLGELLIALISG